MLKRPNLTILGTPLSRSVAIAGLAAVTLGILGAAIYLPADSQFEQRLGIVTMIAAVVLPALVAAVRSDKGTTVSENTKADTARLVNGELTQRVEEVLHKALAEHDQNVHGIPPGQHPVEPVRPPRAPRRFHPEIGPDTHP